MSAFNKMKNMIEKQRRNNERQMQQILASMGYEINFIQKALTICEKMPEYSYNVKFLADLIALAQMQQVSDMKQNKDNENDNIYIASHGSMKYNVNKATINHPPPKQPKSVSKISSSVNPAHSKDDGKLNDKQDSGKNRNAEPIRYNMTELLQHQSSFLSINWENYKDIPQSVCFVNRSVNQHKFMENVQAMFKRRSSNPWLAPSHTGKAPIETTEILTKKLNGVLNKMADGNFNKMAKLTMDIIKAYAVTEHAMYNVVRTIIILGIEQQMFVTQYIALCQYLHEHLPEIKSICQHEWILNNPNISATIRKLIIQNMSDLFTKYMNEIGTDSVSKHRFFGVMVVIAALHNVGLIKKNMVYKQVINHLLPPKNSNLSKIELEAVCILLKRCGNKMGKKVFDNYLQKLATHAQKFDFRTKVLVEQINEIQKNNWNHTLRQQIVEYTGTDKHRYYPYY